MRNDPYRQFDNFDHNFDKNLKRFGCGFFVVWLLSAAATIGLVIFICWFLVQLLHRMLP